MTDNGYPPSCLPLSASVVDPVTHRHRFSGRGFSVPPCMAFTRGARQPLLFVARNRGAVGNTSLATRAGCSCLRYNENPIGLPPCNRVFTCSDKELHLFDLTYFRDYNPLKVQAAVMGTHLNYLGCLSWTVS